MHCQQHLAAVVFASQLVFVCSLPATASDGPTGPPRMAVVASSMTDGAGLTIEELTSIELLGAGGLAQAIPGAVILVPAAAGAALRAEAFDLHGCAPRCTEAIGARLSVDRVLLIQIARTESGPLAIIQLDRAASDGPVTTTIAAATLQEVFQSLVPAVVGLATPSDRGVAAEPGDIGPAPPADDREELTFDNAPVPWNTPGQGDDTLLYVGVAVSVIGVAALATGVGFFFDFTTKADAVERDWTSYQCSDTYGPSHQLYHTCQGLLAKADEANVSSTAGISLLTIGSAATVTGLALMIADFALAGSEAPSDLGAVRLEAVHPLISSRTRGLAASFSF